MTDTSNFTKLVPGFEFLQSLVKNAGSALPNIGHWVAPTLNPEEIEKRIEELRAVKFWIEQNGRMLDATIQALEVQRMTLSTLKTMNVQMDDLREAMTIRMPEAGADDPKSAADMASSFLGFPFGHAAPSPSVPSARDAGPAAAAQEQSSAAPDDDAENDSKKTSGLATPSAIDPMQWWGALTKQFTELATAALQEGAARTAASANGAQAETAPASSKKPATRPSPAGAGKAARPAAKGAKPAIAAKKAKPAARGPATRSSASASRKTLARGGTPR